MKLTMKERWLKREPTKIPYDDLLGGARWWARNAVIMQPDDPWRGHVATICLVALLAPDVPHFLKWLEMAHEATKGTATTTPYDQAWRELVTSTPPWKREADIGQGARLSEEHDRKATKDLCVLEMQRLLNEVRADQATSAQSILLGLS